MSDSKALALIPLDLPGFTALAKQFAESNLMPADLRGKAADVFVTLLAGHELGLSPMAALRGIHVVKGKTILSADTMVGVVLASGACDYFRCIEATPTAATYETQRKGEAEPRPPVTWTIEDAKRAGLEGDNWKKYPRAMLKARCKAELARDVYPDVLAGCYVEDEIDAETAAAPTITPITAKRAAPAVVPPASAPIDADFTEAPASSWDAFAADVARAVGSGTVADEDDIAEAWGVMLGLETRREIDGVTAPLLAVIEKHKADFRVATLRTRLLGMYTARVKEIKAASATTQVAAS